MSNYILKSLISLDDTNLNSGVYLWIMHVTKIPPHLGLSIDGYYFSLKHNGKDVLIKKDAVLQVLRQRAIPTLILGLTRRVQVDEAVRVFNQFTHARAHVATCLHPIQETFGLSGLETVFDLLTILTNSDQITTVSSLNIPETFTGIPKYGSAEIHKHLAGLENATV